MDGEKRPVTPDNLKKMTPAERAYHNLNPKKQAILT